MRAEIFKKHPDNLFLVGPICCGRPRVIWRNVKCVLAHYFPALWGFNLQLEPTWDTPPAWRYAPAILFWLLIAGIGVWSRSGAILGALIAFWVSPLWTYAFAPLNDAVFEYRAYLAVAGWGLLLSILPGWIVGVFVAFWAIESWCRSRHFLSDVHFWHQAEKENPRPHPGRAHNPGCTYWAAGEFQEAMSCFNRMLVHYPDNRKLYLFRQTCAVEFLMWQHRGKRLD